jgi:peptide/nickel transport system ATP-binding protein
MVGTDVVIKVHRLKKYFELRQGFFDFFLEPPVVKAVDDVDFVIRQGEILGVVGESGCGKTTTGRMLTRLEDPTDGNVFFLGRDIALLEGEDLKIFRRNIQMVFQDPYESLNPRTTVLQTVMEPLINHNIGDSFETRTKMVVKALEDSGLAPAKEYLNRFPHELSGGQRQRVSIARALVVNPRVIVADEPVSMLDVSIRAGVLNLMLDLRDKYHMPYLFITHDIAVARYVSDRLAVMYLGKIVEIAETDTVIFNSKHPYTQALLSAVPVPDPEHKHGRITIKGEIPSAINVPLGCRFRPRCPKAFKGCGWEGMDMVDWLNEEEKVNNPDHPMSKHIEELHPDGFSLTITIRPEGDPAKVKDFVNSKTVAMKSTRPLFQAVSSVAIAPGDRVLEIRASSAHLSGNEVAKEIVDLLNSSVEYKSVDHPMFGTLLDVKAEGSRVVVTVGDELERKEARQAGKSRLDSTVSFMNDFVKHYRKAGRPEFKGAREVRGDPKRRRVVVDCSPARMPSARVAKVASEMIGKDLLYNPSSELHDSMLPPKASKGKIKLKVAGAATRWDAVSAAVRKYFDAKAKAGNPVARSVGAPSMRTVKGPKDTVVVTFIKIDEPPLIDLGKGQQVACYLYK